MPSSRRLPRRFEMPWGSGEIVEEASVEGRWHEPCLQLLRYTDGEGAGQLAVRFCSYTREGRFQRPPLMLGEEDIDGLRQALQGSPSLHNLLRRLVS